MEHETDDVHRHDRILHLGIILQVGHLQISKIVHHATHGILIIFYSVSLISGVTWETMFGGSGPCWFFVYVGIFGITHVVTGPFLMAMFRILYMKKETWVKYKIGEKNLLIIFLLLNLLQSIVITYFYVDGPKGNMTIYNFCLGCSEEMTLIVEEYEQNGLKVWSRITKIALLEWGMATQVGEIICYVLFFVHLYQHNTKMLLHNILGYDVIKDRHRKNVISMFGQMYYFVIEIVFLILLVLFLKTNLFPGNLKEVFILMKINQFGLMSLCQVGFSSELRKETLRFFRIY